MITLDSVTTKSPSTRTGTAFFLFNFSNHSSFCSFANKSTHCISYGVFVNSKTDWAMRANGENGCLAWFSWINQFYMGPSIKLRVDGSIENYGPWSTVMFNNLCMKLNDRKSLSGRPWKQVIDQQSQNWTIFNRQNFKISRGSRRSVKFDANDATVYFHPLSI